jgi:protein-tyrosine phosphatase
VPISPPTPPLPAIEPAPTDDRVHRILFVCLGNICRSPTAEVVFRTRVARAGLVGRVAVASAGTGNWHVGMPPDPRAVAHAAKRGYDLSTVRARQVEREDFERFEWILAMDRGNLRELRALRSPSFRGQLGLFLDFAPHLGLQDVPDPYYGGTLHFERVLDLIEQASDALVAHLFARHRTK